jgi:lipid-binding SYLF domain-containing protein
MTILAPRRTLLRLALAAPLLATVAGREALAVGEQQRLVDQARLVVEEFLDNPDYATMRVYVQNAYGILVVPDLLKGGFIVGGQYGSGVMLARDPQTGLWSEPAFYDVYGGSLGLQIGGQTMDMVFTLMNQGAVDKMLANRFKLGADASGALGPVGSGAGVATTTRFGEDVYVFSRNKGLYGGLSVDGTVIVPKNEWNGTYYGQPYSPDQIVRQRALSAQAGTAELRNVLARF